VCDDHIIKRKMFSSLMVTDVLISSVVANEVASEILFPSSCLLGEQQYFKCVSSF